ncbi:VCBS repeat-containing protein [uncultured Winogradskyella sp.]|uniref:VCBS repeat-containing protein n=1 Tax=uncultured Winogradskyella sp. TaxID=395353 RepID=UPI00260F980F|nr:VCBS repeat-containing protein [uncultured Winogradskyella sp.]
MLKYFNSVLILLFLSSCTEDRNQIIIENTEPQFRLLSADSTGINFSNDLVSNDEFNVYKYRNFYNGGGVALGDINNDGLLDVYLTSNMSKNRLYLNKGDFKFEDITDKANIAGSKAWSTGVSMVDINADGFLDIYVCNSGDVKGDNKQNEFFINNGDGTFTDKAEALGLDDKGFSTHASFFDYDNDGDLDVYLLNNSYQAIGSFNLTKNERPKRDVLGGDKLFENKDGLFIDVSEKAGIYGSVIGFGLGVTVGDMNNDGWQDIYVSNDFFERDYLYINKQDGTFKECLTTSLNSISGASMGADAADINNDGYNDIFVTEMLPSEYDRLKTVTTFEDWNKYQYNLKNDYYHQFTRNMLQLNNSDLTFSEVGRFSGVEASDWSWGALFFDMNNDGLKDLFIANGIYKDLTNQDYLRYISNQEVIQSIVTNNQVDYKKLIDIIPSNKVKNHAYINDGSLKFERTDNGLNTEGFSNGSAYGDLDNDGDLDVIVNNVNMPLFVYENKLNQNDTHYLKVILKGEGLNKDAIGAKLKLSNNTDTLFLEQQPVRGFQSSMDNRPNFGFKNKDNVNLQVTWPSGKVTNLANLEVDKTLTLYEKDATDDMKSSSKVAEALFSKDKTSLSFTHKENNFIDFNVERLLPFMRSTEGPKMAFGDVNGDGEEDIFIGGSKDSSAKLFIQKNGQFIELKTSAFENNKSSEDAESVFFDADNDGDLDLYVCSGGIEFSKFSPKYLDRLYINDGNGNYEISSQILPTKVGYHSSNTVTASDIDNDNDIDLFVGERAIPKAYGESGSGFLLINDGKGNFTEKSSELSPEFSSLGMITDATFVDLNKDGSEDLVIVGEFMGVRVFENINGSFKEADNEMLSNLKGWYNTIEIADLDNDGDKDIILGNHGLNSRFKASDSNPIKLYVNDYDGNSFLDPILTFRSHDGNQYPYALRHNLVDQLKYLSKKYPDYESFKNATISDIFTQEQLDSSTVLEANNLSTLILINNGDFKFEVKDLPKEVQFSPIYAISTSDFDKDGDMDILLGGNLNGVMPEFGRYDASYGNYLENLGDNNFKYHKTGRGLKVNGEIRDIKVIKDKIFITKNNDTLEVYKY